MNPVNWARFGLLAALWGCSFAFIKVSLDAFEPSNSPSGGSSWAPSSCR